MPPLQPFDPAPSINEVNTVLISNSTRRITAAKLRGVLIFVINAIKTYLDGLSAALTTASHDAVTLGTAPNGLSLQGQIISLAEATNSSAGAMPAADKLAIAALQTNNHPALSVPDNMSGLELNVANQILSLKIANDNEAGAMSPYFVTIVNDMYDAFTAPPAPTPPFNYATSTDGIYTVPIEQLQGTAFMPLDDDSFCRGAVIKVVTTADGTRYFTAEYFYDAYTGESEYLAYKMFGDLPVGGSLTVREDKIHGFDVKYSGRKFNQHTVGSGFFHGDNDLHEIDLPATTGTYAQDAPPTITAQGGALKGLLKITRSADVNVNNFVTLQEFWGRTPADGKFYRTRTHNGNWTPWIAM